MQQTASVQRAAGRLILGFAVVAMMVTSAAVGQAKGSLLVLADSGATVYLNRQYQGMVTSDVDGLEISALRPGRYTIVLRKSGVESEDYPVEVKAGQQATLDKREFRTKPMPEPWSPVKPVVAPKGDSPGGILGADRFVGFWREQREGTFGNSHFDISLQNGEFFVKRFGDEFGSDRMSATVMTERGGQRSFGVVKLEGKVSHYGGTISMSLVLHAVVRDPSTDLKTDTLAVQYWDTSGVGAKFEGSTRGVWVRMKR